MSGEEYTPVPVAPTPQCQFFVQRKKRLCRMTVKPGRQYCGEHEPQPKTEAGQTDKRIPCPNDPKHTCYASKLLKHLAICNARQTEQPPYIVHNINAPEAVESCLRRPLSAVLKDQLASLIDKVNHLYAKHVEGHITLEPPQPIHRTVLAEFSAPRRAESSRRHLRQVSALLWSAERAGLVREGTCYVELGAGKGQLLYYACHAWCGGSSRVLAVDRAPLRHKRDNKLRSNPPNKLDVHTQQDSANGTKDGANDFTDEQNVTDNGHVTKDLDDKTISLSDRQNTNNIADNNSELKIISDYNEINMTDAEANDTNEDTDTSLDNTTSVQKQNTHSEHKNAVHRDTENTQGSHDNNSAIKNTVDTTVKGHEDINEDTDNIMNMRETRNDKDNNSVRSLQSGSEESDVAVRIRADLAHLALEAVPVVAECAAVVGLAKHLCGVATDYALRCVAARGVEAKTRGAVLATCCHHRIEPAAYVGYSQLQELGINAEELNIMLGIVSWATCGDGRSRARRLEASAGSTEAARPAEAGRGLGLVEREAAGRRAKGLLDWGRVLWLRARGFDARLAHYVPKDVSLENTVILATKR